MCFLPVNVNDLFNTTADWHLYEFVYDIQY